MTLSVALCSHNGERFLSDQLASIRRQARPPDEVVIRDDASSDGTVNLIRRFAGETPFPVCVEANPATVGSTGNFSRAIAACSGDVIVFADQDDVWLPDKLRRLEAALQANPAAGFVFSDAEVADERLNPLGYSLWDAIGFGRREQERFGRGGTFEGLLRRYRVTGATMAFRAAYRDLVLPIPAGWVHDAWIALLIAAVAPCVLIPEPLIRYRQHPGQQHGGRRRGLYAQYRAARQLTRGRCEAVSARYAAAYDRLKGVPGVSAACLRLLEGKICHARRRAEMRTPGAWRLPTIVREVCRGNYARYSLGWKAVAQDLFLG
jgi:glycosyltransferase involved in cell wall biosynthesis